MADGKYNRYKRHDSERWAIFEYANAYGNRAASEKFKLSLYAVKEIRRRIRIRSLRDRELKGVTSERYRLSCLKYAAKIGHFDKQLDFASFAMIQFYERGLKCAEKAWAEYTRKLIGRTGAKKELEHASRLTGYEKTEEDDEPDCLIEFPKSIDGMLAQLFFKYGFKMEEIGDMIGKSEAWVSLKIKPVMEHMRSKYGSEKNT